MQACSKTSHHTKKEIKASRDTWEHYAQEKHASKKESNLRTELQ